MHPFDVKDEILILLFRAHHARRFAGTNNHAVANAPRVEPGVHVDPPGEITAIEEITELRNVRGRSAGPAEQPDTEREERNVFHEMHLMGVRRGAGETRSFLCALRV